MSIPSGLADPFLRGKESRRSEAPGENCNTVNTRGPRSLRDSLIREKPACFRTQRLITSRTLTTAFMEPLNSAMKIIQTLKATLFNVAFSLAPPPRLTLSFYSLLLFLPLFSTFFIFVSLLRYVLGRYPARSFTGKSRLDDHSAVTMDLHYQGSPLIAYAAGFTRRDENWVNNAFDRTRMILNGTLQ